MNQTNIKTSWSPCVLGGFCSIPSASLLCQSNYQLNYECGTDFRTHTYFLRRQEPKMEIAIPSFSARTAKIFSLSETWEIIYNTFFHTLGLEGTLYLHY